jgi:hypothetical protein
MSGFEAGRPEDSSSATSRPEETTGDDDFTPLPRKRLWRGRDREPRTPDTSWPLADPAPEDES